MLPNRLNGLATASVCALLLANGVLFIAAWLLNALLHAGGAVQPGLLWYLFAIFFAFFYASRRLYRFRAEITTLNMADRLGLSFRILLGLFFGCSVVALFSSTAYSERHLAMEFGAVSFVANAVMLGWVPAWLARNFFPDDARFRAAVIGNGIMPESLRSYLVRSGHLGVNIIGYYSDGTVPDLPWPYAGAMEDFFSRAEFWEAEATGEVEAMSDMEDSRSRPDCVLAFNFDHSEAQFQRLVELCHRRGIRLQSHARLTSLFVEPVQLVSEGELDFLVFMQEPLEDPVNRFVKRVVDYAVSIPIVLLLLPPLVCVIWYMQRLQAPGSLLYKELRYGANRVPFYIYKFRTMKAVSSSAREFVQATKNDPRVYRFGRFLRRTSLDEMPQFINVILGEMSVVGPRPHPIKLDQKMEQALPTYRARHFVRPGITGYAQVLGLRGETSDPTKMIERVRKDIQYVRSWSLGLDLKIILQTVVQLFHPPDSAY
jgi:exopolysaccharide biosynthesis polyprenyl glycosylphosphotransferase